jgi:quinol monooxygenase YgiN
MEAGVIAIVAKLTVKDGKADEFEAAAREMVKAVGTAEAGRALMYSLHRSKDDPNVFLFYEQYADDDAIAAHGKTEHMAAFGGKIRDLLGGRAEVSRYEVVTGL